MIWLREHAALTTNDRGGVGKDLCAAWVNHEYERVIYKNNYANAVKFFNIYMVRPPVLALALS